jgi:flagellar biosynthetic protein FliR
MTGLSAILTHLAPFLLVLFRLTGLYFFSPILGSSIIPRTVKVHLAAALAIVIYPVMPWVHLTDMPLDIFTLAPLCAMELLIGYVIGWIAALPMISLQMSGVLMGTQMGLALAEFYNPGSDMDSNVLGQLLFYLAVGAFIIAGGVEVMISALVMSFQTVPLGGFRVDQPLIDTVLGFVVGAYHLAVRVAAPVYCILFLETLGIGFLSKTTPQLNILSFGFPLRIIAGSVGFFLSLTVMYAVLSAEVQDVLIGLGDWVWSLSQTQGADGA